MELTSILVVGSIAFDTIDNPNGKRKDLLGGSATYATVAAGGTVPVHIVGIVGEDFTEEGMKLFQKYSSDHSDLKQIPGKTFRWGGKYSTDLENRETLFTELGVFSDYSPKLSTINKKVPMVFLANIHPALQLSVIEQMQSDPFIIIDTMNLWIETTKKELIEVLKKTNILLINESEAELLSGVKNINRSVEILHKLGPKTIVIKKGGDGAVLYDKGKKISMSAYPIRKVIDTTGAGDSFGGGFISALALGKSFTEALINGSVLGSICVEGFGLSSLLQANSQDVLRRKIYLEKLNVKK